MQATTLVRLKKKAEYSYFIFPFTNKISAIVSFTCQQHTGF